MFIKTSAFMCYSSVKFKTWKFLIQMNIASIQSQVAFNYARLVWILMKKKWLTTVNKELPYLCLPSLYSKN